MSQLLFKSAILTPLEECTSMVTPLAMQRAISTDIVLGMPGHNCRFHGICRVVKSGNLSLSGSPGCSGEIVAGWLLRPEPNYCILLIRKGMLAPEREHYHFSRSSVQLSRSLEITGFYSGQKNEKHLLRAGTYPLRKTECYYLLELPIFTRSPLKVNP